MNIFKTKFEDINTELGVNIKLLEIVAQSMERESFQAAEMGECVAGSFVKRVRDIYVPCVNELFFRIEQNGEALEREIETAVKTQCAAS